MTPQYSTLDTLPPWSGWQDALELFGQCFDLLGGHVLTRHIDMLVESHDEPFFPFGAATHAEPFEPVERLDRI